jgi:Ca2+-binding EF-hand superfamily protein
LGRQNYGTPQNTANDLANPKSELNKQISTIFTNEANFQHQICLLSQNLSANKFFDVEKVYDLLDRVKKGFIDINDLIEFMASIHGNRGLMEEEIVSCSESAFQRLDIDGDGKIGFRDWKSFLLGMKGSAVEESHKKDLHSSQHNFDSQSRPVSSLNHSQYNSNNQASSEYELRFASEQSRNSNPQIQEVKTEIRKESSGLNFQNSGNNIPRESRVNHQIPVSNYVPRTTTSQIHNSVHRTEIPISQPLPEHRIHQTHQTHHTQIPHQIHHSQYERPGIHTQIHTENNSQSLKFHKVPSNVSPIRSTQHYHSSVAPVVEYQSRFSPSRSLPDSHRVTHQAEGYNQDLKVNTQRGNLADTTSFNEVTKINHPKIDQVNVLTHAKFIQDVDGVRRLNTQTEVIKESNVLNKSRSRVRFEQDKLPDLDYDSASIYGREKSPVYSPRSKKNLHVVSNDGLSHKILNRSVTHDLSRLPVPQTGILSAEDEALVLTTLTELLHDFRLVEKDKIELSLRSDFNVK